MGPSLVVEKNALGDTGDEQRRVLIVRDPGLPWEITPDSYGKVARMAVENVDSVPV